MAVDQDTTIDQELFFNENVSGMYTTAAKDELIRTGKFKPEWFPGVKGNNKLSMTIKGDDLLSSGFDSTIAMLQIDRSAEGPGLFDVALLFSDEAEEERRAQLHKKEFEGLAYKEASGLARSWLDGQPDSADSFKISGARRVVQQVEIFFDGIACKRGGYSFTKKTIREFEDAIKLACNVLRNGEVDYNEYERDLEMRRLADDAFNRGMCLSLTGHERNALIERLLREREQESAAAHA